MLSLSLPLTAVSLIMLTVMLYSSRKVGSFCPKYFMRQQTEIGKVNGYIEEMISGQKVVKVFNHEQKVINEFEKINDAKRKCLSST